MDRSMEDWHHQKHKKRKRKKYHNGEVTGKRYWKKLINRKRSHQRIQNRVNLKNGEDIMPHNKGDLSSWKFF